MLAAAPGGSPRHLGEPRHPRVPRSPPAGPTLSTRCGHGVREGAGSVAGLRQPSPQSPSCSARQLSPASEPRSPRGGTAIPGRAAARRGGRRAGRRPRPAPGAREALRARGAGRRRGPSVRRRGRRPRRLRDCASAPPARRLPGCAEAAAAMAMMPQAGPRSGRRAELGSGLRDGGGGRRCGHRAGERPRGPLRRTPRGGREGRAPGSQRVRRSWAALPQAGPRAPALLARPAWKPSRPCGAGSRAVPGRRTGSPLPMACVSSQPPTSPPPIILQASRSEVGLPYLSHPGKRLPPLVPGWGRPPLPKSSLSIPRFGGGAG